jgi:hypothetical protein
MQCHGARWTLVGGVRTKMLDADVQPEFISTLVLSTPNTAPVWELFLDKNLVLSDLDRPVPSLLTAASTGGSLPRNTQYCFRVTCVDSKGLESPPCNVVPAKCNITTGGTTDTNTCTITWGAVTGAASYNVYASPKPGSEILVGNTAALSFVLTAPLDYTSPVYIPTKADMILMGKGGGAESVPIGYGFVVMNNIKVFCTASSNSDAAFSVVLGG